MNTFLIKIDPTKLENPDLDIRYDLYDYLAKLYPNILIDGGYDYVGEIPILVVKIKTKIDLIGIQIESILESVHKYNNFGDDFKDAMEIDVL
ncbi:hypothetical protein LBMAG53_22030 [Planctomycetota bacterium]|nr:hypothetical protein LBMAG53_21750 [Planctomycetota bacterium]GDY13325.1 hypothetical protein LBMAG53_22030 [Planctomycetota bacterium]